jgi:tRNA pseudouridine38-40 synthase
MDSLRIALGIEYDGTDFYGFQKQKSTFETIQGYLDKSIGKVANHEVKTYCSGRTDAGVHAIMQVVHFDSDVLRTQTEWIRGINSYLPRSIRIVWSKEVDNSFHARFSAKNRSYLFKILNSNTPSALWSDRSLYVPQKLDIKKMKLASEYLIGEHDFSSFRGSGCQSKTPIRDIQDIKISRSEQFINVELKANAFLLHMVRIIIGTLLMTGKKEITPKEVDKILQMKDRTLAGKTVSSSGLFFLGPEYPSKFKIPKRNSSLIK